MVFEESWIFLMEIFSPAVLIVVKLALVSQITLEVSMGLFFQHFFSNQVLVERPLSMKTNCPHFFHQAL